jgi:hypothetical protein
LNLQIGRIYLSASDPEAATQTWKDLLTALLPTTKGAGSLITPSQLLQYIERVRLLIALSIPAKVTRLLAQRVPQSRAIPPPRVAARAG